MDKSFVYATDIEEQEGGYPEVIEFARGADLLIHDAQYLQDEYFSNSKPKKGWGHSTVELATDVARKAVSNGWRYFIMNRCTTTERCGRSSSMPRAFSRSVVDRARAARCLNCIAAAWADLCILP